MDIFELIRRFLAGVQASASNQSASNPPTVPAPPTTSSPPTTTTASSTSSPTTTTPSTNTTPPTSSSTTTTPSISPSTTAAPSASTSTTTAPTLPTNSVPPTSNIPAEEPLQAAAPIQRRVLVIVYDPPIPSENNRPLSQVMGWNAVDDLLKEFIADLKACSFGYTNYQIVDHIQVSHFPVKEDGFVYAPDQFVRSLRTQSGFHQPDNADYERIIRDFDLINRVNSGAIDEVWAFGFPYAGFYESRMVGKDAFWCNAPPLTNVQNCKRRFIIMGFSYERGVGEMLESMGHRAESIIAKVFEGKSDTANLWERFTRYDKAYPGHAEVGSIHYAPNSRQDYDWGNPAKVLCYAGNWYHYPMLSGSPKVVDCSEWGNGDIRLHHRWWLTHFPHLTGKTDGISNNWWQYVIDPNLVQ